MSEMRRAPGAPGIARRERQSSRDVDLPALRRWAAHAGQLMELNVAKDARRGDLRKIVGGLALVPTKSRSLYGFIREGLPDEIKS